MTCDNCGYTEVLIRKQRYKGILNGKKKKKTIKICDCCSAWGVDSDEEKIRSLIGLDELINFS